MMSIVSCRNKALMIIPLHCLLCSCLCTYAIYLMCSSSLRHAVQYHKLCWASTLSSGIWLCWLRSGDWDTTMCKLVRGTMTYYSTTPWTATFPDHWKPNRLDHHKKARSKRDWCVHRYHTYACDAVVSASKKTAKRKHIVNISAFMLIVMVL